jgi:hypothetical protein
MKKDSADTEGEALDDCEADEMESESDADDAEDLCHFEDDSEEAGSLDAVASSAAEGEKKASTASGAEGEKKEKTASGAEGEKKEKTTEELMTEVIDKLIQR